MAKYRKRRLAVTAMSIAAVAASLGAPAAFAATDGTTDGSGGDVSQPGFIKIEALGMPGATDFAFQKFDQPALQKVLELGFPGNTENVFIKYEGQ